MVVVGSGKALSNLNCMVSKPPEKTKQKQTKQTNSCSIIGI